MFEIAKAHAYGNDFLFIPEHQLHSSDVGALARVVCARHTGIGGDGLIGYAENEDGSARMRLSNADGSPSELSGNGLRCLAALLLHRRAGPGRSPALSSSVVISAAPLVRVETGAGLKTLELTEKEGARYTFRAAMGSPLDVREETLDVAGESLRVITLNMGNPQCVVLGEDLPAPDRFARFGSLLATHPRFPQGTNVEFATVEAADRVRILIWERGVGPTTASGTGACAAGVAAISYAGAARAVAVAAPGGTQRVEWQENGVFLTGWAEVVFEGRWVASPGE